MEYVRAERFSVYIDTNKQTIQKDFDTLDELVTFVEELRESNEAFYFVGKEREG